VRYVKTLEGLISVNPSDPVAIEAAAYLSTLDVEGGDLDIIRSEIIDYILQLN
jgi:hypothetical protein